MKQTIICSFLLFITSFSFAQSQSDYSYSFGIGGLSIEEVPELFNQVRESDNFTTQPINTLIFKFNDNQFSYRVLASRFVKDDYRFKNECKDCETAIGKIYSLVLKTGFEKNIIYGKLQPFFGGDIGFKKFTFDGTITNASVTNPSTNYDATSEKNGVVITPFLGLKYNLKRITISAESGLDIFYSFDKQVKTFRDANKTMVSESENNWEYLIKPLAILSLQYNFGSQ